MNILAWCFDQILFLLSRMTRFRFDIRIFYRDIFNSFIHQRIQKQTLCLPSELIKKLRRFLIPITNKWMMYYSVR